MSRCRMWRYHPSAGGDKHALPGRDRLTWTVCRQPVDPGEHGCDDCYRALLVCRNVRVRVATVRDERTPDRVLEWFTTDGDEQVAQHARLRLGLPLFVEDQGADEPMLLPLPTTSEGS